MRNLFCNGHKSDKRYLLAFLITLICSIICGIVLYKPVIISPYFKDFTEEYVYNVYNFKNSYLLFTHLLSDLIYLYIIYFIAEFTDLKYLSLIPVFLKGLFFGVYFVVLLFVNSFGGVIAALFVFLPASLISLGLCFVVAEYCRAVQKKFSLIMPLFLSLCDLIVYALLINALFRIVIAIV